MMDARDKIRDALAFVPAHDRDTWLRIGMAVKSELGEAGFDPWDEWSQQADSYKTADARAVWRSIKPNGKITVATLFHEAQRHGFRINGNARPTPPTAEEIAERERDAQAAAQAQQQECDAAAGKAKAVWKVAAPARGDHPYLERKQVAPVATLRELTIDEISKAIGYRPKQGNDYLTGRVLIVPIKVGNRLSTVEMIDEAGRKTALAGGAKSGGYWAAQPMPDRDSDDVVLLVGEGVATVLSAREATGLPAFAALAKSNLGNVAQVMRDQYPNARIIMLADLGNGEREAREAALAVGGLLAVPDFGADRPVGATDFNDLAAHRGHEAVEHAIASAKPPNAADAQRREENAGAGDSDGWSDPLPLAAKIAPEPYPFDALPAPIRAAVAEVQGFTKAPVALVASSALSAMSVASQAHVDVQRADKLQGPVSLDLVSIADSGERKTTCDGFFSTAIRDYQAQQAEAAKPDLARYRADIDAWKAKRDALTDRIRANAKGNKPTAVEEQALRDLEADKPEPPRVPKLLRGDDTPEHLAWALMHEWPSGGVLSAEAGSIFGAHGMKSDSIMRNLALLNILWDGGALAIGRRTSDSFTVQGARLTLGLQVQEATLRAFIHQSGGLARGTGFLARCLVAWPESTQGYRQFTEAPSNWPALASFNRRIATLLEQPVPIGEDGTLSPALLTLTPQAKAAWIAFHDAIEIDLRSGGELYDVRDVASKTADNAVRLAALFHVFSSRNSNNSSSKISEEDFEGASRIAAWHLNEARRFFGELSLPATLVNAARLDTWLLDYCRRKGVASVPTREVQQFGPGGLREKTGIEAAVRELDELGRARLVHDGRRKEIRVNPALLEGGAA